MSSRRENRRRGRLSLDALDAAGLGPRDVDQLFFVTVTGDTTVIGGIYRSEDSITRERVPFLHSIPILGNLFKSFARTKTNRELLIFITPRIIK
mgnify:CR=1 FL=1